MKDTNIIIRCSEYYKDNVKKEADELGMSVSEFFRFAKICSMYLKLNDSELYQHVLEIKDMFDRY